MKTRLFGFAMVATFALVAALFGVLQMNSRTADAQPEQIAAGGARTPVLVELFTSEGCSSCPPADALLAQLLAKQPVPGAEVIALKLHVDYRNRLGWTDPFSSAAFTARQQSYARAFGSNNVYTPQMIVDGAVEFVGSSERRARQSIGAAAAASKGNVELALAGNSPDGNLLLSVRVEPLGSRATNEAEIFLAVTEDGVHSDIKSGENAGLTVNHAAVVRWMQSLARWKSAKSATAFATKVSVPLAAKWQRTNLRAVAFVQDLRTRRVLAIGTLSLAPGS
ncbi:MAG TPA: DUF1223 domain-containing protein [Candidatus Nitrosotenuis sp.]|nr:DUF1223 domain-containing protein [Candidatus Nitrosotenuis sp.]